MLTSGTQPWAGPAPQSTGHPLQLVPAGLCSLLQAGCAAEASPGDAAVAWPWERCPCPSQHAGVRPDCTWAGSSFQALLWPEQCQAQMPEAPGTAPGPLPVWWGRGRGGSWEAGADVVEQSSQHPVGGWGKLGVEAVVGWLYNPPPSTPCYCLIPYAVWECTAGCTVPALWSPAWSRCRHCALVAPDVAFSSATRPGDLRMPQRGCGAHGGRDGQRVGRPLLCLHAAWRGTGPACSSPLTATGSVSPCPESSDDSYVSAGEDPLEAPIFEIPIQDMAVAVGAEVLLKCIVTANPQPEGERSQGWGVGGASVAERLSAHPRPSR